MSVKLNNIENDVNYCNDCHYYKCGGGCKLRNSVYRDRMKYGEELFDNGLSLFEIENKISKEIQCIEFKRLTKNGKLYYE